MSESPVELIVSAFQSEDGADNALDTIVQARREQLVKIREAAVVRRDRGGKLHISERGDLTTGGGAAGGAALGAVIGLFGGPLGALLGGAVGGAIGGLAGRLIDTGIPDDRLRQIGSALQPGTSAIVAMIEHAWVGELQSELDRAGGDTLAAAVTEDIRRQLAAGREVAYSALAAAGGTIATRTSAGADGVSAQALATDGQSFIAGAVEAVRDTTAEAVDAARDLADDAGDAARGAAAAVTGAADDAAAAANQVADATKDAAKGAAS